MSRIKELFESLNAKKEKAFIPYITAGDPDMQTTGAIIECLIANGADMIELGVPFSDPMADGPTIQTASQRALKNKFSIEAILDIVKDVRTYSEIPIILFGYYNPFLQYGLSQLAIDAKKSGADGFLIVDMPPEEADSVKKETDANDLDTIFLLAPTSTDDRMRLVAEKASGFVYFVAVTGVTGARENLDELLGSYVKKIREYTALPVGIGFGISKPEQVREIACYAEAVIVGSAIIKVIEANLGKSDMIQRVGEFVRSLKEATRLNRSA